MEDMKQYWTSDDYLTHFTKIENCVYGTKDEILVYQNDLILPVFFDTGCGFTRNASEAWGVDIPYLVSVPSKQDVTSTSYLKITEYSKENLVLLLESYYSNVDISEASFFDDVRVTERDSTGYVTKVNLGNHTVSGEEFTKVIGLNSNHFYIEDYEDKVRLICNGVGHGVGLSQYGTNAMALEGKTYEEILKHYYTGVELVNIGKDE
jgi:stage II sporulation protein D